jgi:hypothetical protein
MLEFESLSVYGFRTVCPSTWRIEFDPKSDRSRGDVAFKSVERSNVFLSWGPLERVKKKFSSLEDHVKDSVDRVKRNPRAKRVEIVETKELMIESHRALYTLIKVSFSTPSIVPFSKGKDETQEVRSMHLHCEASGRYYVMFGQIALDKSQEYKEVFDKMMESFKCHGQ